MTKISEERAEIAALAHRTELARCYGREPMPLEWWRKQGCWKHQISAARAALIADAPAILAAKIEGLKIASEIARTMRTLKVWFGMAIADEIDARIASLEAEMKEGGKPLSQAAEET